jgi:hypothetical protein
MLVSINSALSNFDARFQNVDFDGIQNIVNMLSDPMIAAAVKADPQNFMIGEMQKNNIPVPDGLHFHWRDGNSLVPPEAADCVPPPASLVFVAAPNKPFELEAFRAGGTDEDLTVESAINPRLCRFCRVCIIIVPPE